MRPMAREETTIRDDLSVENTIKMGCNEISGFCNRPVTDATLVTDVTS